MLIYAEVPDNGQDRVTPGCYKELSWPSYYGDIYWGADNCLYDAKAQKIDGGQCCDDVDPTVMQWNVIDNPYKAR